MTWAQRLKRVFGIEIESCERCGGAVKIIASIEDPQVIGRILQHLGLEDSNARSSHQLPPARAADRIGRPIRLIPLLRWAPDCFEPARHPVQRHHPGSLRGPSPLRSGALNESPSPPAAAPSRQPAQRPIPLNRSTQPTQRGSGLEQGAYQGVYVSYPLGNYSEDLARGCGLFLSR
jgi:hypothetical protein